MKLVYLSPVPWRSFAQRPHKFVGWFHNETQGDVLWVDPYPTRFPSLADLRRISSDSNQKSAESPPSWIEVLEPRALPLEPLPLSGWLNAMFWGPVRRRVSNFSDDHEAMLVIGKPSALALAMLRQRRWLLTAYDAMDDFPAFYSGMSRRAMVCRERLLVRQVDKVLASSTALQGHWRDLRDDVVLVRNGLDIDILPAPRARSSAADRKVLGYVGTIGSWFDWELLLRLARQRPRDRIRLVGPVFEPPPTVLPDNVEVLPPCSHEEALEAMREFDVGLIPFKKNALTSSVDPIKFYEYRALGLPVISTAFGEMALREGERGTFITRGHEDIAELVESALLWVDDIDATRGNVERNDWSARFAASGIL